MTNNSLNPSESDHAWVHENLAAYLAGALDAAEKGRFDAHINACADCFDAFTEARDADRTLQRTLGTLMPDAKLEDRLITFIREKSMRRTTHLFIRRASYATAAAVALAATGVFANYALHQGGRFNNPLSQRLISQADKTAPELESPMEKILAAFQRSGSSITASGGAGSNAGGDGARRTMQFSFANTPVNSVLDEMSNDLGVSIVRPRTPIPGNITVQVPGEVDASQAAKLLDGVLTPLGYAARERMVAGGGPKIIQVATLAESKKSQIPVFEEGDPAKIPVNDNIVTYVIPLKNVDAGRLGSDVTPLVSADADVAMDSGSNSLVVTDTSAKIHRLAEIVSKLDKQPLATSQIYRVPMQHANATEAAREVNARFSVSTVAGSSGEAPNQSGRVYADSDTRTNTLILNGPPSAVEAAKKVAAEIEKTSGEDRSKRASELVADASKLYDVSQFKESADVLRQAVTIAPGDSNAQLMLRMVQDKLVARDYEDIVHRPGQETMRQNVDSSEHLVPMDAIKDESRGNLGEMEARRNQAPGQNGAVGKDSFATLPQGGAGVPLMAAPGPVLDGTQANKWGVSSLAFASGPLPGGQLDKGKEREGVKLLATGDASENERGKGLEGGDLAKDKVGEIAFDSKLSPALRYDTTAMLGQSDLPGGQPGKATLDTLSKSYVGGTAIASGSPQTGPDGSYSAGAGVQPRSEIDRASSLTVNGSLTLAGGDAYSKVTNGPPGAAALSGSITNTGSTFQGNITNTAELKDLARLGVKTETDAPITAQVQAGRNSVYSGVLQRSNEPQPADPNAPIASVSSAFAPTFAIRDLISDQPDGQSNPDKSGSTTPTAAPPPVRNAPTTQPAGASAAAPAPAPAQTAPEVATRKIIRNGTVEFEVRSFDDTYATVATVVAENGGFVSSTSSDKLANGKVKGNIVVRVPPERLDRFLLEIRALGDLKAQQIAANDVTKEYTDIASELRGLRTMETRLLDLIKTGKGEVKDLVEAEKQLGEYRIRIEKLEGDISYYNNLVAMATINITAYEKDIQKPTAAAEQENVNVSVETEEVEAKYRTARKILDDAKGRIVESQLKNTDAEHVAASIVADVSPDKADFVADQLKQLGKVASFNRDRRQTTTGGPGAPLPNTQVEHKDTRFSISLYNLANLAPRESTILRVAVRDVQETYRQTLAAVRKEAPAPAAAPGAAAAATENAPHAAGRILNSNLTGQRPEEMAGTVVAEVRADQADAVLQQLRDAGEVLASSLATNPDNTSTTSAKRGIQVTLVNFASVQPREMDTLNIAVRDVDDAYKKLLTLIRQDIPPAQPGQAVNALLPPTTGRVLTSNVNGQQPEQMYADIHAEIRADQAQRVLDAVRGTGEVLNSTSTETPDAGNSTLAKRGLQVRLINVAAIAAGEAQSLRLVALDVPDAYGKLLGALETLQAAGNARVISSQLNQSDARSVNATLAFEARRDHLADVEKAFKDAGIDFLARNITRSTDTANTLDSKIRFQIDSLIAADALEPRSTTVLSVEVDDVNRAMESVRAAIAGAAGAGGVGAKEVDYNMTRESSGRQIGSIKIDASVSAMPAILDRAEHLGTEKVNQVVKNPQVPDTRFAKERIELTITSREGIVQSDKGLGSTLRAALSSAAGALLYSMYLVVTGVLFILPFALIIWGGWTLLRRRRAPAA